MAGRVGGGRMSNRRKIGRTGRTSTNEASGVIAFAQLFRQACTECTSGDLRWEYGHELRDREPLLCAQIAPRDATRGQVTRSACWTCRQCGEVGMFLPPDYL